MQAPRYSDFALQSRIPKPFRRTEQGRTIPNTPQVHERTQRNRGADQIAVEMYAKGAVLYLGVFKFSTTSPIE